MTENSLLVAVEGGVATLTLNRPDRLNSFTAELHERLATALADAGGDDSVRAILLTGAGRGFCAGQDLGDRKVAGDGAPPDLGDSVERYYNPLIRRIAGLPKPVVCAVNGVAAGAGASLAFACDITLAARSARFIQSFAAINLVPDSGGSWHLPRLAGQARALGLALTGEPLPAERAAEWGLIWRVVDDAVLIPEAEALARRLAALPAAGLAATKALIRSSGTRSLDQQLDLERDEMRRLGRTDDYREGVAAFTEKRAPTFTGR